MVMCGVVIIFIGRMMIRPNEADGLRDRRYWVRYVEVSDEWELEFYPREKPS